MKIHSTNYFDTFIEVAEDTKADSGTIPPSKDKKTVAEMQYEMIVKNPYKFTSDDVFFQVFADRKDLTKSQYKQAREQFFSKGQPCFRASPLTKTYGFGVHCDKDGRIALFGMETDEYQKFLADTKIKKSESNEITQIMETLTEISWFAVIIGTIFYCAFCGIWHRQFAFGKQWEKAMGFERPENWKETNIYYIVPLIACFVSTIVITILLNLTNTSSYNAALKLGFLIGFGIAMAVIFTTSVIPTMKKPLTFGAITGTAQALGITLTTLIIYAITN